MLHNTIELICAHYELELLLHLCLTLGIFAIFISLHCRFCHIAGEGLFWCVTPPNDMNRQGSKLATVAADPTQRSNIEVDCLNPTFLTVISAFVLSESRISSISLHISLLPEVWNLQQWRFAIGIPWLHLNLINLNTNTWITFSL